MSQSVTARLSRAALLLAALLLANSGCASEGDLPAANPAEGSAAPAPDTGAVAAPEDVKVDAPNSDAGADAADILSLDATGGVRTQGTLGLTSYTYCNTNLDCPNGMGSCQTAITLNRLSEGSAAITVPIKTVPGFGVIPANKAGVCSLGCTDHPEICSTGLKVGADSTPWSCQLVYAGSSPYPATGLPFVPDAAELAAGPAYGSICRPPFERAAAYSPDFCDSCSASDKCENSSACIDDAFYSDEAADQRTGHCLVACNATAANACPTGFSCRIPGTGESQLGSPKEGTFCFPTLGSCTSCLDRDGDGVGVGGCTAAGGASAVDCNDTDAEIYFDGAEPDHAFPGSCGPNLDANCNGIGDDKEQIGVTDEDGNLIYGAEHCGSCFSACGGSEGVGDAASHRFCEVIGQGGAYGNLTACRPSCDYPDLRADCSPTAGDGCETQINGRAKLSIRDCDDDGHGDALARASDLLFDCDGSGVTAVNPRDGSSCETVRVRPTGDYGDDCDDTQDCVSPGKTEVCDGYDNDCNGRGDESVVGVGEACDIAPENLSVLGACRKGFRICGPGIEGLICGASLPTTEICDGLDNDCDGIPNNLAAGGRLYDASGTLRIVGESCTVAGELGVCASGTWQCASTTVPCATGTGDCTTGTVACLGPTASADDLFNDPGLLDTNCDGIDGLVQEAIFVKAGGATAVRSATGSIASIPFGTSALGTMNNPVGNMEVAFEIIAQRAAYTDIATRIRQIHVAGSAIPYQMPAGLTLDADDAGFAIIGGYEVVLSSTVAGTATSTTATWTAGSAGTQLNFDGANAFGTNESAVSDKPEQEVDAAITVTNPSNIVFRRLNMVVTAPTAGFGPVAGIKCEGTASWPCAGLILDRVGLRMDGGAQGAVGVDGEDFRAAAARGSSTNAPVSGGTGSAGCRGQGSGGNGGVGASAATNRRSGYSAPDFAYGSGGGGQLSQSETVMFGQSGFVPRDPSMAASGGFAPAASYPMTLFSGGSGSTGRSGGGGGGGAGWKNRGGGGGGAGGCGGGGGSAGGSGGSVFGLVVLDANTLPTTTAVTIEVTAAGSGGSGGYGGAGQEGGAQNKSPISFTTPYLDAATWILNGRNDDWFAAGGAGGSGAGGGGGAGGSGGWAVGIAKSSDLAIPSSLTVSVRAGGLGGLGGLGGMGGIVPVGVGGGMPVIGSMGGMGVAGGAVPACAIGVAPPGEVACAAPALLELGQNCQLDRECASGRCANAPEGSLNDRCAPTGMNYLPAGTFYMGSYAGEPAHQLDEVHHNVALTHPFFLDATEVTQQAWWEVAAYNPACFSTNLATCANASAAAPSNARKQAPIESISFFAVLAFANERSARDGLTACYTLTGCDADTTEMAWIDGSYSCAEYAENHDCSGYRLPTEAEWEYAARAGSTDSRYWGNSFDAAYLWENSNTSTFRNTRPAGSTLPNAFGLYDMLGNVAEFVADGYEQLYPSGAIDPLVDGTDTTRARVIRGGSIIDTDPRVYARQTTLITALPSDPNLDAAPVPATPTGRSMLVGFRLARTALPAALASSSGAISCPPGFHAEGFDCASDTQECETPNGTGVQTYGALGWSGAACVAQVCDAGFEIVGDACKASNGSRCTSNLECAEGNCASAAEGTLNDRCAPPSMVVIPRGSFSKKISSTSSAIFTISRSFFMDETETTQAAWKSLSGGTNRSCIQTPPNGTNPNWACTTTNNFDAGPLTNVDWYAAMAFANARSASEGLQECYSLPSSCTDPANGWQDGTHSGCSETGTATYASLSCTGYRLPTEMEWEYAARAGNGAEPSGANITYSNSYPNPTDTSYWTGTTSDGRTQAVKTRPATSSAGSAAVAGTPNKWGLYDMAGNVFEMVEDWEPSAYPYWPQTSGSDYRGSLTATGQVILRGGSTAQAVRIPGGQASCPPPNIFRTHQYPNFSTTYHAQTAANVVSWSWVAGSTTSHSYSSYIDGAWFSCTRAIAVPGLSNTNSFAFNSAYRGWGGRTSGGKDVGFRLVRSQVGSPVGGDCPAGFHLNTDVTDGTQGTSCEADSRACQLSGASGLQAWNGTGWGDCVQCPARYVSQPAVNSTTVTALTGVTFAHEEECIPVDDQDNIAGSTLHLCNANGVVTNGTATAQSGDTSGRLDFSTSTGALTGLGTDSTFGFMDSATGAVATRSDKHRVVLSAGQTLFAKLSSTGTAAAANRFVPALYLYGDDASRTGSQCNRLANATGTPSALDATLLVKESEAVLRFRAPADVVYYLIATSTTPVAASSLPYNLVINTGNELGERCSVDADCASRSCSLGDASGGGALPGTGVWPALPAALKVCTPTPDSAWPTGLTDTRSDMVLIPAGTFMMGSPATEKWRTSTASGVNGEESQHRVTISRPFYLQRLETTQGAWSRVTGHQRNSNNANQILPLIYTDYYSAVGFANELSRREGLTECYNVTCQSAFVHSWVDGAIGPTECSAVALTSTLCTGYRLPTESEWEYAARAGTTGAVYHNPNGAGQAESTTLNDIARWNTPPIAVGGSKAPNPWGLYDIIGNAWEYVHDSYAPYPTAANSTDPGLASPASKAAVIRGGSYGDANVWQRAAARYNWSANGSLGDARSTSNSPSVGLRLARTAITPLSAGTPCAPGHHASGTICDVDQIACYMENATAATQNWNGTAFGDCTITACAAGFHLEGGACLSNKRTCSDASGTGVQNWVSGTTYDACKKPLGGLCTDPEQCDSANCPLATAGLPDRRCAPTVMIYLPPATYKAGSPNNEASSQAGEDQFQATISRGLFIGTTEVTQAEWKALANNINPSCFQSATGTACTTTNDNNNGPVEQVDWYSATAYANARSIAEGLTPCYARRQNATGGSDDPDWRDGDSAQSTSLATIACDGYRLPTDAEWEYAARARSRGPAYNVANGATAASQANRNAISWNSINAGSRSQAVRGKLPNAFGLYDVIGNMSEWAHDTASNNPVAAQTDPIEHSVWTGNRSRRGGAYTADVNAGLRLADLDASDAGVSDKGIGIRLVRTPVLTALRGLCPSGYHAVGTLCEPDLQACDTTATNAVGTAKSWNAATNAFGACLPYDCTEGFHLEGGACLSNSKTCTVDSQTGVQNWTSGTSYTACALPLGALCTTDANCASTTLAPAYCATAPAGTANDRCAPAGMNFIASGSYIMGSPAGETGRVADEIQHRVTLSRPFFMGTTEVTQAEWALLAGDLNPSCNQSGSTAWNATCTTTNANGTGPVEKLDWYAAVGYANARSESEGLTRCYDFNVTRSDTWAEGVHTFSLITPTGSFLSTLNCTGYRLPTEAEWEYAARAGTTGAIYNNPANPLTPTQAELNLIAWNGNNSGNYTHTVGGRSANNWGLFDMLGNVWEFQWDVFAAYPTTAVTDPIGVVSGSNRGIRGSGLSETVLTSFRAARRATWVAATRPGGNVGFRLVRTAVLPVSQSACPTGYHVNSTANVCDPNTIACSSTTSTTLLTSTQTWNGTAYGACTP